MNQLVDGEGKEIAVRSREEWEQKREQALMAMQEVMGPLPGQEKRCALEVEIIEEVDCDSYVRRLISYASDPDNRVTAYLLVPKGEGPLPAMLCLHPTDNIVGHKVVVGLSEKENRAYASELAARGFVALAPSYPHLAQYWPDWQALGYESATMKAIWDNVRGLDLLQEMPEVKGGALAPSVIRWADTTRSIRRSLTSASRQLFRAVVLIRIRSTRMAISPGGPRRAICRS